LPPHGELINDVRRLHSPTLRSFLPHHGGLVATFVVFIADVTIGLHLLMEDLLRRFVVFIADVTIGLASSRGLVERRFVVFVDRLIALPAANSAPWLSTAYNMDILKAA
jgi:hypothetical protein